MASIFDRKFAGLYNLVYKYTGKSAGKRQKLLHLRNSGFSARGEELDAGHICRFFGCKIILHEAAA